MQSIVTVSDEKINRRVWQGRHSTPLGGVEPPNFYKLVGGRTADCCIFWSAVEPPTCPPPRKRRGAVPPRQGRVEPRTRVGVGKAHSRER